MPHRDSDTSFSSRVMIGLGSNMERPVEQIRSALREIGALARCSVIRVSSMYQSAPVGGVEQANFINAVAEIETTLSPRALMNTLLEIEGRHGRVRSIRNGPRTLDLDILMFNDWLIDEPDLVVPHPRAHERAFVLQPLHEICPDISIPGIGAAESLLASVSAQLVERCMEAGA